MIAFSFLPRLSLSVFQMANCGLSMAFSLPDLERSRTCFPSGSNLMTS